MHFDALCRKGNTCILRKDNSDFTTKPFSDLLCKEPQEKAALSIVQDGLSKSLNGIVLVVESMENYGMYLRCKLYHY